MRKVILCFVGLILTNLAISQTISPELVSSSGNSFKNLTYQLDWSVGESVTTTQNAENYVITQGFHQDKYIITSAIKDLQYTEINISVYPNPTTDIISLKIQNPNEEKLHYKLTDMSGKVLKTAELNKGPEQLSFSTFPNGVYFLTVKQENQTIKLLKIIKN